MRGPAYWGLAAVLGALATPALADDTSSLGDRLRMSGQLRGDYFEASRTLDGQRGLTYGTAQVKLLPVFSERVDGKFEGRVTSAASGEASERELLEGYVTVHFAQADLRLGKQIVAWGRADGINPTDNLTPRDYTVRLPFEDDQRFGTPAVKLDWYLTPAYTLTVFASRWFRPARLPLPVSPALVFRADDTEGDGSVGVRLNQVSEGFDWSVSAFQGPALLPELRLAAARAEASTVALHYGRVCVLGADFARNFGRYGMRGELAYGRPAGDGPAAPGARAPWLSWIAGIDRTYAENLNLNLQFFQRRVRDYRDPAAVAAPLARAIAVQSAVINGQRDRISNGISFRVSDKWFNDALEAEVFAVANLTRHDHLVRPLLTYAFTDHWKGTVGAEFYSGADDTQFGSQKSRRGAFAELRYGF